MFKKCETIEEIKKEYKRLAKKLHPDAGGSEQAFKDLLRTYEEALKNFKDPAAGVDAAQLGEELAAVVVALSDFDLEFEIVGAWLWISGNTYAAKETLKSLKCKWGAKRKKWYFHTEENACKRSFKGSFEELRARHGSAKVTAAGYQRIA